MIFPMAHIDPIKRLKDWVAAYPTMTAAAQAMGISPQYLSDVLKRRRTCSPRVLKKIGLQRVIVETRPE